MEEPLHILVLVDRDWTHPQAGGTGALLEPTVRRWLGWGHRVTVVTSSYPGAAAEERRGGLVIHRKGRLKTAIPWGVWRVRRGLVPDADVALELVNGVFFFTPLWLRVPCVTLVQHLSGGAQYRQELGRKGPPLGFLLETAPLRYLYGSSRFMTISRPTAESLASHGVPSGSIEVNRLGLEPEDFNVAGPRAAEPTLIHLGRLKRYKNIELVLDIVESLPGTRLELAGDGDHRPALEREIEERGLADRVIVHGFVPDERKRELLRAAWVNVVASSAEGWGLSVTEAGACATPSAALAVGGLTEAIDHGRTGLLAADAGELRERIQTLIEDPGLRDRLGNAALERSRGFTWDETARRSLEVLEDERRRGAERPTPMRALAQSDTGRAAGLAGAAMATNIIGLAVTILFARLLGADDYGSLAALVSAFLILAIPGQALQVAVARETARSARLGLGADVRRWLRELTGAAVVTAALMSLLREPLADLIGVEQAWGAAAVLPSACMWLALSIQRGVLQGVGSYRLVGLSLIGEAALRLLSGGVLIGVGLGATGGFLGTGLSIAVMAIILERSIHRALPPDEGLPAAREALTTLARRALVPLAALALIAWLQNVDVIMVKRMALTDEAASSYAAVSVAAKMVIWIGVGLGLFLLPEAARRTHAGSDGRPVLTRSLALVAAVGVPMVLFYAVAGRPMLEIVFGPDLGVASDALPWLGLAMSLLASVYLATQFLLALGHVAFLGLLGAAAALEPVLLVAIGPHLTEIGMALAALELALAVCCVTLGFRRGAWVGATRPQAIQ